MELSDAQNKIVESPLDKTLYLHGPAGTGKTTSAIARLKYLADKGVPGYNILLFFPQRNLSSPYSDLINSAEFPPSSKPALATLGGLARRVVSHFWPIIKQNFSDFSGTASPVFLTLESSLYFMSKLVEPLILEQGYFSSVTIQRNRLYSQILDNLNKSAVNVFPHTEIGERLVSSWIGETAQGMVFHQAQECAALFREHCYQNNLLDYSLQVEIFLEALSSIDIIGDYIQSQYKHLIYDNCEEDVPAAHDLVRSLLTESESALIIFDDDAGYRSFLGASPSSASMLSASCDLTMSLSESYVTSKPLASFSRSLSSVINRASPQQNSNDNDFKGSVSIEYRDNLPELAAWVGQEISSLISTGVSPGNIVILAPYLSDSSRFILTEELTNLNIPHFSHRPSRALRDEPAARTVLTLAALAHPEWNIQLTVNELSSAFYQVIKDIDLPRAYLLSKEALSSPGSSLDLLDFDQFSSALRERITFYNGNRYQTLVNWMREYQSSPPAPLDHFITLLFGEILAQPGYGFHDDFQQARIVDQIRESFQKFRQSAGTVLDLSTSAFGAEYSRMVKTGILANQHLPSWNISQEHSTYIAPAYTYLLSNQPVEYQFWLDTGSRGWYERIFQPLTNPYVLARDWTRGEKWSDTEEQDMNLTNLDRLSSGLIRRCKKRVYFCLTETDEMGYEQKGLLLQSINTLLQKSWLSNGEEHVH